MNEWKFTPGPWRVQKGGNIGNLIEAQSGRKAHKFDDGWRSVATFQDCCASTLHKDQQENQEANGALIAAAPQLFEALEIAQRELDALINRHYGGNLPCTDEQAADLAKIDAALAAARGGK